MTSPHTVTPLKPIFERQERLSIPRSVTEEAATSPASYSLWNPPQAPKKKKQQVGLAERRGRLDNIPKLRLDEGDESWISEDDAEKLATGLLNTGRVSTKWQRVMPKDIADFDIDELREYEQLYFPSSQPKNVFEGAYVDLILKCLRQRINYLCSPPSPSM